MKHRSPGLIKWTSPDMPLQKAYETALYEHAGPGMAYSLACRLAALETRDGMIRS